MLKLIVSIDDLSPELKKTMSAWGETHNVQIKDLRECERSLKSNVSSHFNELLLFSGS
jgi:hypothetical protein